MLFQFSTTGSMEREESCESFDLLLQTLHQVLLHEQTPLSLELGIHNGEVIQAFRTQDEHSRRAIKNALRNVYPTSRLSTLPDDSFRPPAATSMYFADVDLANDLYSINRWQQLLTQSDPLSTLLGSLVVNQHARFFGHVSITLFPLSPKHQKVHHRAFEGLQSKVMQDRKLIAKAYEFSARSHTWPLRIPAWLMKKTLRFENPDDTTMNLGSARHHERETDVQSGSNKLSGSCFQSHIRIRVFGPADEKRLATSLIHQIFAPLAQFNAPRLGQFRLSTVRTRRSKKRPKFLLSCQEVSSIFHPPVHKTESLATSRFIQLEPPRDLPFSSGNRHLMKLGQTCFHSTQDRFGLLDVDAALHGFVVGSSGSGKTTLLTTAIMSLIKRGQGITLVDFHGDFARSIENAIPKSERSRLVHFSPLSNKPIAFNPLFCPDSDRWPVVADSILSGMRNLFGHSWGPRLEQILQMALSAAIAAQGTTLAEVRKMLSDEPTRVKILSRVDDPIVRQFWFETFASWGKRLQVEATQSVINKLDALLTPKLRAILCQSGESFDFRSAFDDGKIVIVNLARGEMGQTAASTLGSLVLSSIQNAALSRAEIPEDDRIPHSVFLDELQLYSNPQALTSLLAEARKYRVAVWSATQSLGSLDSDSVLPIVLSNAANFISFRVSQKDAVEIAPMLDDAVKPQDLVALPRFHGYARLMVNGEVQAPFSFSTVVNRSNKNRS
jgi:hypothetical protein